MKPLVNVMYAQDVRAIIDVSQDSYVAVKEVEAGEYYIVHIRAGEEVQRMILKRRDQEGHTVFVSVKNLALILRRLKAYNRTPKIEVVNIEIQYSGFFTVVYYDMNKCLLKVSGFEVSPKGVHLISTMEINSI